jgi:glycosyltransferase involved in cell wall biosynthesis
MLMPQKTIDLKNSQDPPMISVVMATYNGAQYLEAQLTSILAQTYSNIEVVMVDDASTDETVAIINKYMQLHVNISLYCNEHNLGYIKTFEKGMILAKGAFIALSDQDDIWQLNKLAVLIEAMNGYELVYSNSLLVDENGNSTGKKMSDIKNQINYTDCLMYTIGAWAPGHAMLFKKELADRCMPFPAMVTHDFWLGFVAACKGEVHYIDLPLVHYRQHAFNAIGANTHAYQKSKPSATQKLKKARARMQLLFEKCPEYLSQKKVLEQINKTYQSYSFKNNLNRMRLFFRYRNLILAYKKKSALMKLLFCLKTFFKIDT